MALTPVDLILAISALLILGGGLVMLLSGMSSIGK